MPVTFTYQIVVLDATGGTLSATLIATCRKRVAELGLAPDEAVRFFTATDVDRVAYDRAPLAAVYFGGDDQPMELATAASQLRQHGAFILPVVPDLAHFTRYVPTCLHPVNGKALDPSDPNLEAIAQRLLEELRLVRDKRLLFISYKRSESGTVAEQLYRVFDERAFDVFLDTHSVRSGLEFQSILWDQVGDADLLILLDTPKALSSRWVAQELARANAIGLGVAQLIWPGHARTPGTDFAYPVYLEPSDFEPGYPQLGVEARLRPPTLQSVATLAESLRARSVAARRTRIVGELCRQAIDVGFEVDIQPARCIDVRSPKRTVTRVFPVVGHPDSLQIHTCFDGCGDPGVDGVLLYDPLGMLTTKSTHLAWLNDYLPLKALPITDVQKWLTGLL